jgi:hypothetical protein
VKQYIVILLTLLGLTCNELSYAQQSPVTITGAAIHTIRSTLPKHRGHTLHMQANHSKEKRIALLRLSLNDQTRKNLARHMLTIIRAPKLPSTGHYPRQIQLGMNHVPVLDQGEHATCAMFAGTAALDAALDKGDYVSQLCQLDLSQYLHRNAYSQPSWNGGLEQDFMNQITLFGIVPKTVQHSGGCVGRVIYPLSSEEIDDELSVFDFHQISESIQDYGVTIVPVILADQMGTNMSDPNHILNQIKSILRQGDRVICSVILMGPTPDDNLPSASFHVTNDSWVLLPPMTEEMNNPDGQLEGHAFVITGYDDDAIAVDETGKFHRGLVTLRNSWGDGVGDHGDFYMSYAYLKATLLEAHRIKHNASD